MASGMTKTQLVRHLAEKVGTNNKTAATFLEHLTDTAVKETKKNGLFVVPGLGRLKKCTARPAWDAIRRPANRSRLPPRPRQSSTWLSLPRTPSRPRSRLRFH